jgi:hypothetical protein
MVNIPIVRKAWQTIIAGGAGLDQAFQFSYVHTYVCPSVRTYVSEINFGPYTFVKGQRDNTGTKGQYRNKGTTKGQQRDNKGPKEQGNTGPKEHRNKGTKEQKNKRTKEDMNKETKKQRDKRKTKQNKIEI